MNSSKWFNSRWTSGLETHTVDSSRCHHGSVSCKSRSGKQTGVGSSQRDPRDLSLLTLLTVLQISAPELRPTETTAAVRQHLDTLKEPHTDTAPTAHRAKPMKATTDQTHNSAFSKWGLFCLSHLSIRKWNVWARDHTFYSIYFPSPRNKSQYHATNFAVIGNIK